MRAGAIAVRIRVPHFSDELVDLVRAQLLFFNQSLSESVQNVDIGRQDRFRRLISTRHETFHLFVDGDGRHSSL